MTAPAPPELELPAALGLRQRALRAAAYLTAKHGGEMALALGGEPALVHALGPASYGLWIASYGVFSYMTDLGTIGVDAYLLRIEVEPPKAVYDQAFTMLLIFGLAGTAIGAAILPILQWWMQFPHFAAMALPLIALIPVELMSLVPLVRLERQLEYRAVAKIEVAGRAVFYLVACALAFAAIGARAPIAGFIVSRAAVASSTFWRARYRPRLHLEYAGARDIMRYGMSYSAAGWIWGLTALVNPLIVGRYAGPAAVAYIGFTERTVAALAFAKGASIRLSMPLLARLQNERERLAVALSEGILLQVMLVAPCLLLGSFGLAAIVPILREDWAPLIQIYPFVAAAALANSVFSLQSSTLYVLKRNYQVGVFHFAYLICLLVFTYLLVQRFGWVGYGWAGLVAIPTYAIVNGYVVAAVAKIDYRFSAVLAGTVAIALFWRSLGPLAFLGVGSIVLWPSTRGLYHSYIKQMREALTASNS